MKKKIYFVIILITMVIISAFGVEANTGNDFDYFFQKNDKFKIDKTIAVLVNEEPIYLADFEIEKSYQELTQKLALKQIDMLNLSEKEKDQLKEKQKNSIKTENEILDGLIQSKVLLQEAQRQGVSVDIEEAYNMLKSQYEIVKEIANRPDADAVDKANYQFILAYQKHMGYTEDEYLQQTSAVYQRLLIQNKLLELNAYPSTGTDKITSYDSQKEAVDDYITELVSQADVIYYVHFGS